MLTVVCLDLVLLQVIRWLLLLVKVVAARISGAYVAGAGVAVRSIVAAELRIICRGSLSGPVKRLKLVVGRNRVVVRLVLVQLLNRRVMREIRVALVVQQDIGAAGGLPIRVLVRVALVALPIQYTCWWLRCGV